MPKSKGLIVKLGGSLARASELPRWLAHLADKAPCVIVPGGGEFVEPVRATQRYWQFSDHAAHRMAILAMAEYGLMLHAMEPRLHVLTNRADIQHALEAATPAVWVPQHDDVAAMHALPMDWSVSADSIALWVAGQCAAECLCLLKSRHPGLLTTPSELAADGFVDTYFPTLLLTTRVPVIWFAKDELALFASTDRWGNSLPHRLIHGNAG